jgi:hypothetical protein
MVNEIFKKVDLNQNGRISSSEFSVFLTCETEDEKVETIKQTILGKWTVFINIFSLSLFVCLSVLFFNSHALFFSMFIIGFRHSRSMRTGFFVFLQFSRFQQTLLFFFL